MSAPTVNVTIRLFEQDGDPIVGAVITAKADINDLYAGFIVPVPTSATTDATGSAVIACFPNKPIPSGLGLTGSTYRFKGVTAAGRKVLDVLAQVPNVACNLDEIAVYEPLPGVFAQQGPQGPAGPQGAASTVPGPTGPAGLQGETGATGATGAAGAASTVPGPQGAKGDTGSTGAKGDTGDTGAGLNILGELANTGLLPVSGAPGDGHLIAGDLWTWNGASWVNAGQIQGPQGLQGIQGIKGDTGNTGLTGAQGVQGVQGNTGPAGVDATPYTHPTNHSPSIITQDASNRFVTDAEKATWNAKQPAGTYAGGTGTASGTNTGDQDLSAMVTLAGVQTLTNKTLTTPILNAATATGLKETKAAVAASAIDLATGNYFSKTAASTLTWTVTNVPTTGTAASFILDLTNGGSAAQTWWTGVKWAGGTAPTLTAAGRDVLGFFTHDGGTTWTGLVLGKDVK